jgi:hypothetical protein
MIYGASPRLPASPPQHQEKNLAFLVSFESVSGQALGRLSALRDCHQLNFRVREAQVSSTYRTVQRTDTVSVVLSTSYVP